MRPTRIIIVALTVVACGDRETKPPAGSQAIAAAENKRKPPGAAEVNIHCYPDLAHLKPGADVYCGYDVRWTGEPPLFRDDPYYHVPLVIESADSSVFGPRFPPYPPVPATDSSPARPGTPASGPMQALKVGHTTLKITVRDKSVVLPVTVEDFPNVTVRWEPASETTLYVGQTLRARIVVRDSAGGAVDGKPQLGSAQWGVGVVRVDTSADRRQYVFTALAPGRLEMSAGLLGRSGRLVLIVKDTPAVKPFRP